MEELKCMRYQVGSFIVEKEQRELDFFQRELSRHIPDEGIFSEIVKENGSEVIYYISIKDMYGLFKVEYAQGTQMYKMLDTFKTDNDEITDESAPDFLSTMFLGCTMTGDAEYWNSMMKNQMECVDRMVENAKPE